MPRLALNKHATREQFSYLGYNSNFISKTEKVPVSTDRSRQQTADSHPQWAGRRVWFRFLICLDLVLAVITLTLCAPRTPIYQRRSMLHNKQCPDVIIVGAGIAGLEAARTNGSYAGGYLSGHRAAEEIDTAIRCGGLAHRLQSIFFRDCDPVGRIVWDIVTLMAFVAIVIATSLIAMEIFSYKTDPPFIVRFTPTALRTATVIAIVAAIVSSILVRNKVELVGLTILIGGAIYALMVHENLMSGER